MTSRNRPHGKYNLSARQKVRQEELNREQEQLQAQQRRANIDAFLINSASNIYSGLVAKEWDGGEPTIPREVLLGIAGLAKDAANALGESLGFLNPPQIQVFETPQPADDEAVELPVKPVIIEDEQAPMDSVISSETPTITLDTPTVVEDVPVVSPDSVISSETPTITLESVE